MDEVYKDDNMKRIHQYTFPFTDQNDKINSLCTSPRVEYFKLTVEESFFCMTTPSSAQL